MTRLLLYLFIFLSVIICIIKFFFPLEQHLSQFTIESFANRFSDWLAHLTSYLVLFLEHVFNPGSQTLFLDHTSELVKGGRLVIFTLTRTWLRRNRCANRLFITVLKFFCNYAFHHIQGSVLFNIWLVLFLHYRTILSYFQTSTPLFIYLVDLTSPLINDILEWSVLVLVVVLKLIIEGRAFIHGHN